MAESTTPTEAPCRVVSTCRQIRAQVAQLRSAGRTIGLVPTMGALHDGHLSLVAASNAECDATIVSIFVNPAQFDRHEDLQQYPRSLADDVASLQSYNVDVVFAPPETELYPGGFSTYVDPPAVAEPLEGRCRPGHFRGVTTVVLKLMNLIPADVAFFGQKDYQQAIVMRRMVEDLNLPVRISVCTTIREPDGLAISSRNAYLKGRQRQQACVLSRGLELADELVGAGERDAATLVARMRQLFADAEITRIDYIAMVHPETLEDIREINGPTLAAVAAYVGKARLIDNRLLGLATT